jgi:hypothetical protein
MSDGGRSGELVQLNPHTNMSAEECLAYCARNASDYSDVIVVGYDAEDGSVVLRSSHITRAEAAFMLMEAIDRVRDK